MPNYGEVFKELRVNRNLTLSQLADEEVSIAQLSRFERGESDLSVRKFFHALDKMHLTADEFMDRVHQYKRIDQIALMSQMAKLHYQGDVTGLAELRQEELNKYQVNPDNKRALLNSILFRGMICDLDSQEKMSQDDLNVVADHLFCTEEWHIEELILIGNLYRFYETDYMCRLIDEVLAREFIYQEIATYKNLVEVTLLNVIQTLVERSALAQAQLYDQKLQPMIANERKAYHRLIYLYVKGFLLHALGQENGRADMEHAIQAFEWMGSPYHAATYRKHFEEYVS